ncbi:MAG: DUF87 domain-containing protein [Nitrososphaeraceae archaeon]|nr:DUF87 domain-containing protein [Nitrososphaeraceae archaeon]
MAQSGSGKSFFLGRLIEEIKIKSKARCLNLDPNGDFTKINEIDEEVMKRWSSNQVLMQKYDIKTGLEESRSRPKMNLQKNGKL